MHSRQLASQMVSGKDLHSSTPRRFNSASIALKTISACITARLVQRNHDNPRDDEEVSVRPASEASQSGAAANLHERKGSMYSVLIFPLLTGSDDIAADGSHRMSGPWHLTNIATFPDVRFAASNEPAYAGARCARGGVRGNDGGRR